MSNYVKSLLQARLNEFRLKGWSIAPLQWHWNIWNFSFQAALPGLDVPIGQNYRIRISQLEISACILCKNRLKSVYAQRVQWLSDSEEWLRWIKVEVLPGRSGFYQIRSQGRFGPPLRFISPRLWGFVLNLTQQGETIHYSSIALGQNGIIFESNGAFQISPFLPISGSGSLSTSLYQFNYDFSSRNARPEEGYTIQIRAEGKQAEGEKLTAQASAELEKQEGKWKLRADVRANNLSAGPLNFSALRLRFWNEKSFSRWQGEGTMSLPSRTGFYSLTDLPVQFTVDWQKAETNILLTGKIQDAHNRIVVERISQPFPAFLPVLSVVKPWLEWESQVVYRRKGWEFPRFQIDLSALGAEGKIRFLFHQQKFTISGSIASLDWLVSAFDQEAVKQFEAIVQPSFFPYIAPLLPEGLHLLEPFAIGMQWDTRTNALLWSFVLEKVQYRGQLFSQAHLLFKPNYIQISSAEPFLKATMSRDKKSCHYQTQTKGFPIILKDFIAEVTGDAEAFLPADFCRTGMEILTLQNLQLLDFSAKFSLQNTRFKDSPIPPTQWEIRKKGDEFQGMVTSQEQTVGCICAREEIWKCTLQADSWDLAPFSSVFPDFARNLSLSPMTFTASVEIRPFLPGRAEFRMPFLHIQNILWQHISGTANWDEQGIRLSAEGKPAEGENHTERISLNLRIQYPQPGQAEIPFTAELSSPYLMYVPAQTIQITASGEVSISGVIRYPFLPGKTDKQLYTIQSISGSLKNPGVLFITSRKKFQFSSQQPIQLEILPTGELHIPAFTMFGEGGSLNIYGGKFSFGPKGLSGEVIGEALLPAQMGEHFFPQAVLDGEISAIGTFRFRQNQWDWQARGTLHSLSFSLSSAPAFSFQNGEAVWQISGDTLRILSFSALHSGGMVYGSGEVQISEKSASLDFKMPSFWLEVPPGLSAKISGYGTLALRPDGGFLAGSASVLTGEISLEALPFAAAQEVGYPISLAFRLDIPGGFHAKGESYQLHPTGYLYFTSSLTSPRVYGTLEVQEEDEIRILGKSFQVQKGMLEWFGSLFSPRWFIEASRMEYPYHITATIEGSLDQPEVSFTSDPPLPSTDILAFLLTGRTMQDMDWELGEILTVALPAYLSREVPPQVLDRLSVVPITSKTGQKKPFLLIGKNLGEGIFLTYGIDLESGSENFSDVRWNFLQNWEAHLIQDTSQKIGAQLSYRTSIRARRRPAPSFPPISTLKLDTDLSAPVQEKIQKILSPKQFTHFEEECRKIRKLLQEEGFLRASCEGEWESEGVAQFTLRSGLRYSVELLGWIERETESVRRELLLLWSNQPIDRAFMQSATTQLRHRLYEKGFAFATVQVSLMYEPELVRATFILFPKEKVFLQSLEFEGNYPNCAPPQSCFPFHPGQLANRVLLSSTVRTLEKTWRQAGYLDARLLWQEEKISENSVKWSFTAQPGPLYLVQSVQGIPEEIPAHLIPLQQPFSIEWMSNVQREILRIFANEGYLDATVSFSYRKKEDEVDVFLSVEKGIPYILHECRVEEMEEEELRLLILRWLKCKPGQKVSLEEIRKWRGRLLETGFFRSVVMELHRVEEEGVDVVVRAVPFVQAVWQVSTGYLPDEGASTSLSISRNRAFHRWKRLAFTAGMAERRQFAQSLYSFTYAKFPGIFFSAGASVEKKKIAGRLEQRWGTALSALYRKDPRSWISFRLSADRYNFPGRTSEWVVLLSTSAISDTRNDILNPSSGHLTRWTAQFTTGSAKFSLSRSSFFPLPLSSVLALSLRTGIGFSLSYSELFVPGGELSLRGLSPFALGAQEDDAQSVGGSFYLIGSAELRRRFTDNWGGYIFAEGGNLWKDWRDLSWQSMRFSAGTGIFYSSPLGPFRLEYARLLDPKPGEKKARISFSLGFSF